MEERQDLISRQVAIDALRDAENHAFNSFYKGLTKAHKIIADLPSAQPEPHWIPCSERLPENEYVLISKKQTMISGDKWSVAIAIRMADPRSGKIQWRDSGFGVIHDDKVLAWMPIPIPYCGGYGE